MELALKIIVGYFCLGIIALGIFDLTTKRIRTNWRDSVGEAQTKLANSGNYMGRRMGHIALLIAMLIFWWLVLIGSFARPKKEKNG
jgi:hypothetical protein